jgi:hypothetical protein
MPPAKQAKALPIILVNEVQDSTKELVVKHARAFIQKELLEKKHLRRTLDLIPELLDILQSHDSSFKGID